MSERCKPAVDQPSMAAPSAVPVYDSKALLGINREIIIRHAGKIYRLRLTRQDKLILTK